MTAHSHLTPIDIPIDVNDYLQHEFRMCTATPFDLGTSTGRPTDIPVLLSPTSYQALQVKMAMWAHQRVVSGRSKHHEDEEPWNEGSDYFSYWDGYWSESSKSLGKVVEDEDVSCWTDNELFWCDPEVIDDKSVLENLTMDQKEDVEFLDKLSDLEMGAVERLDTPMQPETALQTSHLSTPPLTASSPAPSHTSSVPSLKVAQEKYEQGLADILPPPAHFLKPSDPGYASSCFKAAQRKFEATLTDVVAPPARFLARVSGQSVKQQAVGGPEAYQY
jgi:hypothetical protein